MLARRFLYVVAALIALVLGAGMLWSLYAPQMMRMALVPSAPFMAPPAAGAPDYARADAWTSRPGLPDDPAAWLPPGVPPAPAGRAAIFFVAPTTAFDRARWNAAYDDPRTTARTRLFVGGEASAFSAAGRIWAPRYRQAIFGAFLTERVDGARALDLAYGDVSRAWDAFLTQAPADAPLILAAHSQGSLHLARLLAERIRGTPAARRIVAAYVVGAPLSATADVPALGLPPCAAPTQTGCMLGWQSFADPADPGEARRHYDATVGMTGRARRGTPMLCVDPITGTAGGTAPAAANLGALVPASGMAAARLVPGLVPARCRADGMLSIGAPPAGFGAAVLPGNNYHVFDYALFWANIRADALRRLAAFGARR